MCLPHILKSDHPHILNISPPLNLAPQWFANHVAYTMAKYGMSMCVLGMAKEFAEEGVGVNALWPRTAIQTAAVEMLLGESSSLYARKPDIVADAAYAILTRNPKQTSGNFFIDDEVLKSEGINDMLQYACHPENADKLVPDAFLDVETDINSTNNVFSQATGDSSSLAGEKIENLFKKIESSLSEEVVRKTNAVFHFTVKGKEAGSWFLDLKSGSGRCGKGESGVSADATLTMDSDHFFDMFTGKLKATTAFMSGKLKIKGDMTKAMKLEKLMSSLKAKL